MSAESKPHSGLQDRREGLLAFVKANQQVHGPRNGVYIGELEQEFISLFEQLEALQDAVDDAILVFEDTKWWEAYHHLLSPLPASATYRDGDVIEDRPGWFWSEAEGRPVWNPAKSPS